MKRFIFLSLSVFIFMCSFAQPSGRRTLALSVEKKASDTVTLQFKPGSALKIKTIDGKNLRSANYVYQDSALVMVTLTENGTEIIDTIPFRDIVKIRGKVYGNADRKVAGAILALTGVPLLGFTLLAAAWSADSMGTAIVMLPVFAIPASGISLMGARSFNTSDKWTLKTTPSVNHLVDQDKTADNQTGNKP